MQDFKCNLAKNSNNRRLRGRKITIEISVESFKKLKEEDSKVQNNFFYIQF